MATCSDLLCVFLNSQQLPAAKKTALYISTQVGQPFFKKSWWAGTSISKLHRSNFIHCSYGVSMSHNYFQVATPLLWKRFRSSSSIMIKKSKHLWKVQTSVRMHDPHPHTPFPRTQTCMHTNTESHFGKVRLTSAANDQFLCGLND